VDSLCIIQDDEDDWRRESALMSEVYANAVVNIAAAGAKDGSVGLFFERDVVRESKYHVQISDEEIYEFREPRLYERCLQNTCLTSRGWCFQERFLARRTLHFTRHQIILECRDGVRCDSNPDGLSASTWKVYAPKRIMPTGRDHPGAWFEAVSIYSATQLTFARDRLVAISGVAR
ncbi:HET-domain-containing protein, partial [Mollisia scopiformis]